MACIDQKVSHPNPPSPNNQQVACIEQEVHDTLKNLKAWMAPEPARVPAVLLPATW